MRLLLDTHVLLWWFTDDPRLRRRAREYIADPANTVLVSAASGWEIATKLRIGKLPGAPTAADDLPEAIRGAGMEELPVTLQHAVAAGSLPGPHRDPFDRVLIAQSRIENAPVVTAAAVFKRYRVKVIW